MPGNPHDMITSAERASPSASGSVFRQAVSANGMLKLPPGLTRIAAPTAGL